MERGVRSGEPSGSLVKKKSSSGCLIIKKKGVGVGVGSSGSKKVFESKEKRKRSELVLSDSDSGSSSSDELLEPLGRKVVSRSDKHYNGSVAYKTGSVEDSEFGRNGEIDSETKRSRLDVFEFDEYDAMDRQNMRKSYMGFEAGSSRHVMVQKRKQSYFEKTNRGHSLSDKNRFEMEDDEAHIPLSHFREKFREHSDEPIRLQGKNGVLKVMMNKKNKVNLPHKIDGHQEAEDIKVSSSKDSIKKNRPFRASLDSGLKQSKNQVSYVRREKNEPNLGKSMSTKRDIHMGGVESETEDSDTSLKVGSTSAQARSSAKRVKIEDKGVSSAEKITPIIDNEGKIKHGSGKKPVLYVRREKSERKLGKSTPTKSDMARKGSETEDSDTSMKVGSTSVQARSSRKGVKNKVEKAKSAEKITPIRGGERKVQRGSGTEKQLLREKIKNMLVNAGWTIDYRPRRNRDYLDAVYINPSGTAYWSIIKAYDALQKDINVNTTRESSSFTPLPNEILNKLTRQTQKKIEKEMKKKRRNNGGNKNVKQAVVSESEEDTDGDRHEEKLSSFVKQNGRKSRKIGRCTLLVRGSDKGLSSESDGFVPYLGKRSLLSWLIDSGPVQLSEKVQYMNRRKTRVLLEGWITRDGIHCGCCSKILTVSKFEIHAGSKLRQPFQNIYLESGVSLLQCQIDAWNKQEEGERCGFHTVDVDGDDPNDDTCGLCGDGGDLICCDGCPSTFHQSCLDIQMLPLGDWHCPNCTCKFCGIAGASVGQENGTTVDALLTCSLCEKKYHELCSQEDARPANSNVTSASFCGRKCRELFDHIQKLLGVKHELEAGFSWSLIHRTDPMSETSHRGFPQRVESNSKLAVALSIMDECFLPIVDRRSGVNLIHNVLYNCGSNFSRLNYSGFYTAILERGDEIISAASIRMHGTQLAEMPFIATRQIYRRQGMCRRLFCAIETALCSIKVEKMVIPAIAELMHTWTEVFGFSPLDESPRKEMRSMNMLVFPGTDMLQKLLLEQEITEGNIIANSGAKSIEIKENHGLMTDSEKKSALDSSAGCGFNASDDANVEKGKVVDQNLAAPKSKVSVEEIPSFGSESVEKLVESAADLNCSSSDTSHDILERENTPAKENTPEDVNGHHNPVSSSSIHDTIEITVQVNSDLNHGGVVDMESDVPVVSEVDSNPEVARVEGKIRSAAGLEGDAPEVNEEVADTGTVLDSPREVSAQNTIEKVNGTENHVLGSTLCGTGERVLELNSDMNQSSEVKMEADVDSDAKVDPGNAKVGVKPVYDSLGESFAQDSTEENHDNENPILGSTQFGVENTLKSSAVEDLKDGDAVNSEVTCVKPVLDSVEEISVQNGAKDFQENLNSSSVSTVCGSDESELTLKSNSNHQNALSVECELAPATVVVSEEVTMIGSNNQPKAEDDASGAPVVES